MRKSMKTTVKQFEEFKKEAEKWVTYFGLSTMEVRIVHANNKSSPQADAWCWYKYSAEYAEIGLTKTLPGKADDYGDGTASMEFLAFHEVCHLLLGKFGFLASTRFLDSGELESTEHEIIRRLENSVFKTKPKTS